MKYNGICGTCRKVRQLDGLGFCALCRETLEEAKDMETLLEKFHRQTIDLLNEKLTKERESHVQEM
jgi:hypothetical protein